MLISRDGPCFSVAFLWYLTRALYRVSASYSFLTKLNPYFNKFKTTKPLQTLFVWRSCLFWIRFSSISWICVFVQEKIHTWDLELMEEHLMPHVDILYFSYVSLKYHLCLWCFFSNSQENRQKCVNSCYIVRYIYIIE